MVTIKKNWSRSLRKNLDWIAIPNLAFLLVSQQAIGCLCVWLDPIWINRLALYPDAVKAGEYWRLVTFLALPLSRQPIGMILTLWFLSFVVNLIEESWGAFKTTLYVLSSVFFMIAFSFIFRYPITEIFEFNFNLFVVAATLFPEAEVSLWMVLPIKMKWLVWISFAGVLMDLLMTGWTGRLYFVSFYLNYLIFLGSTQLDRIKQGYRRRRFKVLARRD